MTGIATAQQSKANWMKTYIKLCSRLNNKNFDTILIADSITAGLTRYSKVWNKYLKPLNALNSGIEGCRVKHLI